MTEADVLSIVAKSQEFEAIKVSKSTCIYACKAIVTQVIKSAV